jgi:tetratricopeptide (TPR) repeat protein
VKEAYPKAANAIEKSQIDQALCEAYAKGQQWKDLATTSRRLMTSKTFNEAGFEFLIKAMEEQKDWKGLETAALEQAKNKQPGAWKYVAIARIASGNTAGAAEAIEHFKSSVSGSEAIELAAWNGIRQKRVTQDTLDSVKKTDSSGQVRNPYVVALLELQLKKTEEAQDTLKQAIRNADVTGLDARAWVVYGHICDQYGFHEAAQSAWARARSARATAREAQWALRTIEELAR